ncbi:hypothetical protein M8C21_014981, partial [Ambrosia artemisiifolia]
LYLCIWRRLCRWPCSQTTTVGGGGDKVILGMESDYRNPKNLSALLPGSISKPSVAVVLGSVVRGFIAPSPSPVKMMLKAVYAIEVCGNKEDVEKFSKHTMKRTAVVCGSGCRLDGGKDLSDA